MQMPLSWCHGILDSQRNSVIKELSMSHKDHGRLEEILNQCQGNHMGGNR